MRFIKLGSHCEKIGSGSTPRGGHKSYVSTGTAFIRSQNVLMREFSGKGLAYITDEIHAEMAGTEVQPGDVLLNITGASIGRVCMVPADICPANVNQHVCIIRCGAKLVPQFVMMYLSSPAFQKLINEIEAGGTRQALTKADIEDFEVPELDTKVQEAIASSLASRLAEVSKALAAAEKQLAEISLLPAKILQSAFEEGLCHSLS